MNALITGATGFIGRYLVELLTSNNWNIICLSRDEYVSPSKNVQFLQADISKEDELNKIAPRIKDVDCLYHLAAYIPDKKSDRSDTREIQKMINCNITATLNLLNLSLKRRIKKFIYASSMAVIGRPCVFPVDENHILKPDSFYALSKLCAECLCEEYRISKKNSTTSLRISAPYGSGSNTYTVLPIFLNNALNSKNLILYGRGTRRQDLVHVEDVVSAFLSAYKSPNCGVFNIASGSSISMEELAELIIGLVPGTKSKIEFADEDDPQENYRMDISIKKARVELNYRPSVELREGISRYVEFIKGNLFQDELFTKKSPVKRADYIKEGLKL